MGVNQPVGLDQRLSTKGKPAAVRNLISYSPTTLVERSLLFSCIVVLPMQDYFPAIAGMSVSFLLFAVLAAYVIMNRPQALGTMWQHPVFIAAYAFIVISVLMEFTSPLPQYAQSRRFAEMIGGTICVAILCRDRPGLTAGLYGYIAAALWVSVALCLTSYGMLQGMGPASDFHAAEKIREEAFQEKIVGANLNRLAFVCTQGALVAFALCLSDKWERLRAPLLGIVAFCLIASFLPMSRGSAIVGLLGFAVIFYTHGGKFGRGLVMVCVLGLAMYTLVPEAVWSRMVYTTEVKESGKMEARAKLYTLAIDRLPEYIVGGVGAGNFYNKWAVEKGFSRTITDGRSTTMVPLPAHNAIVQLTIYWGILALSMFLLIMWCVYRLIPLQCGRDELSLALLGIIVSFGAHLLYGTDFSDKAQAIGVGMLVGARRWIWPSGVVSTGESSSHTLATDSNIRQTTTLGSSSG